MQPGSAASTKSKGSEQNMNKFVALTVPRDGLASRRSNQTPSATEAGDKAQRRGREQVPKNSYSFRVKMTDKERTLVFPMAEVLKLAGEIGIDLDHDKTRHIWFLQQSLMSELPYGWQKEYDTANRAVYHNFLTKESSFSHPNVFKFRVAFNNLLKSEEVKQVLIDSGIRSMTDDEKSSLQTQLNELSAKEKAALARKMRVAAAKDGEKAAGELTKQIFNCNADEL